MGHHIDEQGRFQSDKYPGLGPDKVVISLKDPLTRTGLMKIALAHIDHGDRGFGDDLLERLCVLSRRRKRPTVFARTCDRVRRKKRAE